jgi:serine phosphatase RsbU (regulator of sigma subunit)
MKIYFSIFFILLNFSFAYAQKTINLDSILQKLQTLPNDTAKLRQLTNLAWRYRNSKTDKSIELGLQAIKLSETLNKGKINPQLLNYVGVFYEIKGEYPISLSYFFKAIKIADSLADTKELGFAYNNVANINYRLADYRQSELYALKAIREFEKVGEQAGMGYAYIRLSEATLLAKKLPQAKQYINKSMLIRQESKDTLNLVACLIVYGKIAKAEKNYDSALMNFEKAKKILKDYNNPKGVANVLNNITEIYILQNKVAEAEVFALQSLAASEKSGAKVYMKETYHNLAQIYALQKNYDKALNYQNLYLSYKNQIFNEEKAVLLNALHYRYEYEDETAKFDLLQKQAAQNKVIMFGSVAVAILLLVLLTFLIRSNYTQRKENYKLKNQRDALNAANNQFSEVIEVVNSKNEHIISSIQYAKRIQNAALISEANFKKIFPQSFIFFSPKDIVSGDFYWAAEKETIEGNLIQLLAVADCTGHGVAGAFMSLIGCSILDQIVHNKEIHQPDLVLAEMHTMVRYLLRTDETESPDGMDISLCFFDKAKGQILFAGATQSAYIVQHGQLNILKGDRKSIGGVWQDAQQSFTLHTHTFLPTNVLYLFTDGYSDQFGGTEHKRFSSKNFKALLEKNSHEDLEKQKEILQTTFITWLGTKYKAMDDIAIIGIKG